MKQIKLNDKVTLDLDKLIAGKMLLQAGSGGGKSYAIRRILEQSFGEIPHLILDTEGEFSSLREKYDYILIGKGFDINADPKTAALLALRLWEERVSAIIDLYELSPWDRQLFVKNFVDALINAPKKLWKPVLLVIDEAHEYAPENDKSDSGRALHLLASKGRKRHIGAIFATQRISSLSKNIVASCKNKLIGYASETNDVKRAAFELGFTPNEARTLRDLDPGEFYAFGPALTKEVTKIKIGSVKTSHENNTSYNLSAVKAPSDKVKRALAKLADLPQAAAEEARTVAELKAALAVTQKQLKDFARLPSIQPVYDSVREKQNIEVALKKFKDTLYQKLLKSHGNVSRALEALSKDIEALKSDAIEIVPQRVSFASAGVKPTPDDKPLKLARHSDLTLRGSHQTYNERYEIKEPLFGDKPLSRGALTVLTYLESVYPHWKSKAQMSVASLYVPGGGFSNMVSELTSRGLIERDGSGKYAAKHGGGEYYPNIENWIPKVSLGAGKVFKLLLESPDTPASKEWLADQTGYSLGGGFSNMLSELTSKELVIKVGKEYKINPEMLDL